MPIAEKLTRGPLNTHRVRMATFHVLVRTASEALKLTYISDMGRTDRHFIRTIMSGSELRSLVRIMLTWSTIP